MEDAIQGKWWSEELEEIVYELMKRVGIPVGTWIVAGITKDLRETPEKSGPVQSLTLISKVEASQDG